MSLAPVLLSSRGLTGWVDPTKIVTGDLISGNNLDFTYGHMLQKEPGTLKVNAVALTGSPTILCGFDWWPSSSTQRRVVATSDGKIYKDDMTGAFATTLKSGLGTDKLTQMTEAGAESQGRDKKLFICNGNDPVQVLSADGATTANIGANAPTDWTGTNQPSFMFRYRTALVGGGNLNDPHRVYISSATDHEDFRAVSGGLSLSVYPGEGQRIVAGLTAFGKAYLFKYPTGIYYVVDDDTSSANWFIRKITGQYGAAASPHSVVQIDQATVVFLGSDGDLIMMQENSGSLTGIQFTNLTKELNLRTYLKNTFNLSRLDKSQLRWYPDALQLHVLLSATGTTIENRRLIVDFNGERPRLHVSNKDVNTAIWVELHPGMAAATSHLAIGDNTGFMRELGQVSRTLEGVTAYTLDCQTVATDFSDINPEFAVKKNFYRLHLEYEVSGAYDIGVEIIVDGVSKGTVFFNQGSSGSVLPFTLPAVLGGQEVRRRTRAIVGEGYNLSLRVTEGTTNNPRISRMWVEFDPLEMTL